MEKQENDENNADIKATTKLETDVEERMPSFSDNEDNETVKLENDIYFKEEQPNSSYIETNIMEFEEEAVAFIKPERSDPFESDNEEQEEDIVEMKEVKVLLTKFDEFTCVVCDRDLDKSVPMGACKRSNEIVLCCKDCIKPNGKTYACHECNKLLSSKRNLKNHISFVHNKMKASVCLECNKEFTTKGVLKRHINNVHRGPKDFICEDCNRGFTEDVHLREHVSVCHDIRQYDCQECDKVDAKKRLLKLHVDLVHKKLKFYRCELCKTSFVTRQNLRIHVDNIHKAIKKYACAHCGKAFVQKEQLKTHIAAVHLLLKQFACPECDKAFSQRGQVRTHYDAVHKKIKKARCGYCNLSFANKQCLKTHIYDIHKAGATASNS